MAGSKIQQKIVKDMLEYAKGVMEERQIFPWIAFVVKGKTIVSRGYNTIEETLDPTMFSGVTAVRWAQESLDPGNLKGYTLYSVFQPVILDFDIALFAGIRDFVWCIDKENAPEHYSDIPYSPFEYLEQNPGSIKITHGIMQDDALKLLGESVKKRHRWYESLYQSS